MEAQQRSGVAACRAASRCATELPSPKGEGARSTSACAADRRASHFLESGFLESRGRVPRSADADRSILRHPMPSARLARRATLVTTQGSEAYRHETSPPHVLATG